MQRRTLIATLAALPALTLAGCVSEGGQPGGSDDGTENGDDATDDGSGTDNGEENDDNATPAFLDADLEHTGGCTKEHAETADVSFGDDRITVEGCQTAHNGCVRPQLAEAGYKDDVFRLVVEAVDESDADEVCTQAIEFREYGMEATFDGGTPARVDVVHDLSDRRETVATVERD